MVEWLMHARHDDLDRNKIFRQRIMEMNHQTIIVRLSYGFVRQFRTQELELSLSDYELRILIGWRLWFRKQSISFIEHSLCRTNSIEIEIHACDRWTDDMLLPFSGEIFEWWARVSRILDEANYLNFVGHSSHAIIHRSNDYFPSRAVAGRTERIFTFQSLQQSIWLRSRVVSGNRCAATHWGAARSFENILPMKIFLFKGFKVPPTRKNCSRVPLREKFARHWSRRAKAASLIPDIIIHRSFEGDTGRFANLKLLSTIDDHRWCSK